MSSTESKVSQLVVPAAERIEKVLFSTFCQFVCDQVSAAPAFDAAAKSLPGTATATRHPCANRKSCRLETIVNPPCAPALECILNTNGDCGIISRHSGVSSSRISEGEQDRLHLS